MYSKKFLFFLLFLVLIFTRFFGFKWGNSYFFQPDENNMAIAVSRFTNQNLNPHFYAYGQFPLYLAYFTQKLAGISNTFANSIYILRFWSAVFSILSVIVLYLIYPSFIFAFLLIFTPGLIQLAHFGTTESLLILVFVSTIYLSLKKHYFWAAIICAIGIATKVSAIVFVIPMFISLFINTKFIKLILYPVLIIFLSIIFSPYNLIDFPDFISAFRYESSVATGSLQVFYTRQFVGSIPYVFQVTKIFPYIAGLPMFILSVISIIYFRKNKINQKFLLILLSSLVYFLYFGQVFVKWARFMSPLFFIFPLLSAVVIDRQKKYLKIFLILISIIPGLIFMSQYFRPDIRVAASDWMVKNLPPDSYIFSESGNVVNLPVKSSFIVNNYDFYSSPPPTDFESYDYILVPSRRVFKNGFAPNYYQKLFSDQLDFKELVVFNPFSDFLLNPENAEETWSVFDHPTIRLYQNEKNINL